MEGEEVDDAGQTAPAQRPIRRRPPGPANGETIYHGYCNIRIHELAQPRRWLLLYTYKNYCHRFESERAQAVKERVQEMFGMTPEEAELYFNSMRAKKPHKPDMKVIKQRIRREKREARKIAYRIFHTLIRKAMKYAYKHAPPLLVTPMLRIVSDHMLQLLAELHHVDVPKRTNTDNLSLLLISIADWCALFVTNIYYELEVEDRREAQERIAMAALPDDSESTITTQVDVKEAETKVVDYDEAEEEEDLGQGGEEAGEEE